MKYNTNLQYKNSHIQSLISKATDLPGRGDPVLYNILEKNAVVMDDTITTIGSYAFYSDPHINTASFPRCTTIASHAFNTCVNLTTAGFSKCTSIGSYAFQNCHSLSAFYLSGSTVCQLAASNVFASTPYTGYSAAFSGTPRIYVPASLITSYKNATNWTYFSTMFTGI